MLVAWETKQTNKLKTSSWSDECSARSSSDDGGGNEEIDDDDNDDDYVCFMFKFLINSK